MKCALVVGHEPQKQGATNGYSDLSEYAFNSLLAVAVSRVVKGVEVDVVYRDAGDYDGLPDKINALRPDFGVSLHCNSHKTVVSGSEVLYWQGSVKGEKIASLFRRKIAYCMGIRDRGIKGKKEGQKGAHVLEETNCPFIILEPFFINNLEDVLMGMAKFKELTLAIAEAIEEAVEVL
ncbi:MAG: N-acetylmuramoyl-L-alanine amidase [Desulfobulbaceae bacterium]|nr:N-acetylmuramoyl-L-alanine amidase [Desulfobulbaceae bacterium]